MPRALTQLEFEEKLYKINPNIKVLGKYKNRTTKIQVKCLKDEYIWETTPNILLSGYGCPKCGKVKRRTKEDFVKEMYAINPFIEILSDYVNIKNKIKCRCLKDGYEWYAYPGNLLKGHGCSRCANNVKRTHEQFLEEMKNINPYLDFLSQYQGTDKKITYQCKKCKYIGKNTALHLLQGEGCPKCKNISNGEYIISKILKELKISFFQEYRIKECKDNLPLPFDFFLPDYNILIEFQGKQHYKSSELFGGEEAFIKTQVHDKIKKDYCKNNNIKLIIIPYTDLKNLDEKYLLRCINE